MPRITCCDEVFDVLTRGPFPSGAPGDVDVELHLRGCHECRQLAEALRPAVGLFHESLREDSLPTYQGRLSLPDFEQASEGPPQRTALVMPALVHAVRIAAAVMLIATACLAVSWIRSTGHTYPRMSATPNAAGMQRLASLKLPAACLPNPQDALAACCTVCHAAALAQSAPAAAIQLARSCQACHE